MKLAMIFVLLTSNFLILRTVLRIFGQSPAMLKDFKTDLLKMFAFIAIIFAIEKRFLIVICVQVAIIFAISRMKNRKEKNECSAIAQQIILFMRAGFSFESSLAKTYEDLHYVPESSTNGWVEFESVLVKCKESPSLSFKLLNFYCKQEKLRQKLHTKQKNISLQAKMQSVVSCFLYFGVFFAQIVWNQDFSEVFNTVSGRLVFLLSLILLSAGVFFVFKLSQVKEENL